jgi:hypothetical protein
MRQLQKKKKNSGGWAEFVLQPALFCFSSSPSFPLFFCPLTPGQTPYCVCMRASVSVRCTVLFFVCFSRFIFQFSEHEKKKRRKEKLFQLIYATHNVAC